MKITDQSIRTISNRYSFLLQLYRSTTQASLSFSLARAIHGNMIASEFAPRDHVLNRLIDIYCKSSNITYARHLFDKIPQQDIISRTTLIHAYSESGNLNLALGMFRITPQSIRDDVFYNVMITGFARNGDGYGAFELFNLMRRDGFRPDNCTLTSVLSGLSFVVDNEKRCEQVHCGAITSSAVLGALENGRQLHAQIIQSTFDASLSVGNAIITMYARCGVIESAHLLFRTMPSLDAVSWNVMVAALGKHGHGVQAIELFKEGYDDDNEV